MVRHPKTQARTRSRSPSPPSGLEPAKGVSGCAYGGGTGQANGQPHYVSTSGSHLYYYSKDGSSNGDWLVSTAFTPDQANCRVRQPAGGPARSFAQPKLHIGIGALREARPCVRRGPCLTSGGADLDPVADWEDAMRRAHLALL